jgi:hypothetical protein
MSKKKQDMIFRVSPSGTIVWAECIAPETRDEAFDFGAYELQSAEHLVERADLIQPITWELQRLYEGYHQEKLDEFETEDEIEAYEEVWPQDADEGIALKWVLQCSDEDFKKVRSQMEDWAKAEPDLMNEVDFFQIPAGEQDAAYKFFSDGVESEVLARLDIRIVEGEYPGSTYYAAELRIPVEEANARAGAAGIAIRFEAQEE